MLSVSLLLVNEKEIDSLNLWRNRLRHNPSDYNRRNYNQYLASAYVYHKRYIPIISQRLMQGNMQLNRLVWDDMIRIGFDCKEELKSFDAPVLILQGIQDVIPDSLAFTANSVFPNATMFLLNQSGHYGWLDQKEKYIGRIKQFLDDLE